MLFDIMITIFLVALTTTIHAGFMLVAVHKVYPPSKTLRKGIQLTRLFRLVGIIFLMFSASLVEVLVWAVTYMAVNATQGLEKAFYFSMVTFTTLGYGDILLSERWRFLASFEAAIGIIMFGWTTAIVIAAVQRYYFNEGTGKNGHAN